MTTIPPHLLIERSDVVKGSAIGAGGTGKVYEGKIQSTNKPCAIKEVTGPGAFEICQKECAKVMTLHHDCIVPLIGLCKESDVTALILTELSTEGTLKEGMEWLRKQNNEKQYWTYIIMWSLNIARGLEYLHQHSPTVLHLDMKPANAMLFEQHRKAKSTDFGISKITEHTKTSAGMSFSPQYAAPEQWNQDEVGPYTDVYGLGATLFELILQRPPWEGERTFAIATAFVKGHRLTISCDKVPIPGCPPELIDLANECLELDPTRRSKLSDVIKRLNELEKKIAIEPRLESSSIPDCTTDQSDAGSLPAGWLNPIPDCSLTEAVMRFEGCPCPPSRPELQQWAARATKLHLQNCVDVAEAYIPSSDFGGDQNKCELARTIGAYTDETCIYHLTNGWCSEPGRTPVQLEPVYPFMAKLCKALPSACPMYRGGCFRVLRVNSGSSALMQQAYSNYERHFALGKHVNFYGFASFSRGMNALEEFLGSDTNPVIVLSCHNIEAYDIDAYSILRMKKGRSEQEVLCSPPSFFRVCGQAAKIRSAIHVPVEYEARKSQLHAYYLREKTPKKSETGPCKAHPSEPNAFSFLTQDGKGSIVCCPLCKRDELFWGKETRIPLLKAIPSSIPASANAAHAYLNDDLVQSLQQTRHSAQIECLYLELKNGDSLNSSHVDLFRSLPNLHTLWLSGITDGGLAHVKSLTSLTMLNLCGCKNITDGGLAHLKSLTSLTSLKLSYCKNITDGGLAHLQSLTSLTNLDLGGCKNITDGGLAHLKSLTSLTSLTLWGCENISDVGLAELKSLTSLTNLDLGGCSKITLNQLLSFWKFRRNHQNLVGREWKRIENHQRT